MARTLASAIDPAAHLGLVRLVAARLARSLPGRPDPRELWGDGYLGLAAAAARFDPQRGCAFSTYAVPRIEGTMRDGDRARRGWRRRTPGKRRIAEALSVEHLATLADPAQADDTLIANELEAEYKRTVRALRRALRLLPEIERAVLSLRYFEELPQRDIAAVFGVTPSRISQIESNAIGRLRQRLKRR